MNNTKLIKAVQGAIGKVKFNGKKYSPEILIVSGIVLFGASLFAACKSTLKVTAVVETAKQEVDRIHEVEAETETEKKISKDITAVYARTAINIGKLYLPAVIFAAASITCMLASNGILKERSASLAAAYATLSGGFDRYRKNVVEQYGPEADADLFNNVKEISEVDEDGTETKIKVSQVIPSESYSRYFDNSKNWDTARGYNDTFIRLRQNEANELLQCRGYLFLNEVYDLLGFDMTEAGASVGWLCDKKSGATPFVDFGMTKVNRAFNNEKGYITSILLNFNVQGDVLHSMGLEKV